MAASAITLPAGPIMTRLSASIEAGQPGDGLVAGDLEQALGDMRDLLLAVGCRGHGVGQRLRCGDQQEPGAQARGQLRRRVQRRTGLLAVVEGDRDAADLTGRIGGDDEDRARRPMQQPEADASDRDAARGAAMGRADGDE